MFSSLVPIMATRRRVLGAGLATVTATAAGCDLLSTDPSGSGRSGGSAGGSGAGTTPNAEAMESPALVKRVRVGELPPLAKRLPRSPLVVEPTNSPGVYGGTWHTSLSGASDTSWCWYTIGYDPLLRWNPDWTDTIPNVAEEVEVRKGGREYVIHLREGMRWSDGRPFTAADILFAYDDVLRSEQLDSALPASFVTENKPGVMAKVDDHTVTLTFSAPNGLLRRNLASGDGMNLCMFPRHYLGRFHARYNRDADELAKDQGYSDWTDLFASKTSLTGIWDVSYWQNPKMPSICAWQVTEPPGSGTRVVAERNPYYWKVDPDGRQLPYLDAVEYLVIEDPQTLLLKATHGDFGMDSRHFNNNVDKPVLARSRDTGAYDFFDLKTSGMNQMVISLNLTQADPVKREIYRDKDFRIGLSHAIDRRELIKTVFSRVGEPWQAAPREDSGVFDEKLARQYTAYDVAQANAHLDKAGHTTRDSSGRRLGADGRPLTVSIDVRSDNQPWIDALQLVKGYWAKVGIQLQIRSMDRSLADKRREGNQQEANVWGGDGGSRDALIEPRWYFPFSSESSYAVAWAEWYTSEGRSGERPPAPARRQMELYEQVKATPDPDAQRELFLQILAIAREQFYVIGTALPGPGFGIVKDGFRNVPGQMPDSSKYNTPGPTRPEQYYIKDT